MQFGNLSPEQLSKLLGAAGGQLGMDPGQLKQQIESGNLSDITSKLTPEQSAQMGQLLSDPAAVQKLLSNPQVAGFLQNFMKGK